MSVVVSKNERRLLEFDGFRVDPVRRRLMRDGEVVPLTPKALSILLILLEKRGEIVEKEELIQKVWPDTFVTEANLTQNISSLRKALGERASESRYIVTVPGRGYCFAGEVVEVLREPTGEIQVVPDPPPSAAPPAGDLPVPSVATVDAPEPGPAVRPEHDSAAPVLPLPERRRLQAAGLLLLLLAAAVSLSLLLSLSLSEEKTGTAAAEGTGAPAEAEDGTRAAVRRRSIAVLGFKNLAGESEKGWLATALSEMLTTELAAGGQVRVISGENVSRVRQSLSLPYADNFKAQELQRLHSFLGADLVVIGSYLPYSGKIRLDLRVLELPSGDSVASVAEVGTEPELFDLVSRTGVRLRRALGWTGLSPEDVRAARALRPASPEAARHYVEGLARLRTFDFRNALDLLEKAAAADPGSPVIHSALSQAWTGLGYDGRGAQEAEMAFQLAGSLPKEERLAIEARLAEAKKQWDKASEIYGSLWTFYPDDIEHGLRLANAQIVGGRTREAIKTIAALRRLPPPEGRDPRIDLAEAMNAKRMANFEIQMRAAKAAEVKGRYVNESLVVAQALALQGDALLLTGALAPARAAYLQARDLFTKAGDSTQAALMLTRVGVTLHEESSLEEARQKFEEALDIVAPTGSIAGRALQIGNLGIIWRDQGDLRRAQEMLEQARDLYVEAGDRALETRTLTLLGPVLLTRGEIAEGGKLIERALTMARQSGNRLDEARALDSLALVRQRQGEYAEARRLHEQAWAIARELKDVNRGATMEAGSAEALVYLGNLPLARKRFSEALAVKRRVGDTIGAGAILGSLARLSFRAGDLVAAKRYSQDHLSMAHQVGARLLEAEALRDQGLWSFASDDLPGARRQLEEALERLSGLGADLDAASCRLILASVALAEGKDPVPVERVAREVAAWYGARGIIGHEARALLLAAQALLHQGRVAAAGEMATRARSLAVQNEDREIQVLVTASAATIDITANRRKEALGQVQWAIDESKRSGLVMANLSARLSLGAIQLRMRDREAIHTLQAVHQESSRRGLAYVTRQARAALQGVEKAGIR
jgi:DNA-binding winged helix-turn-helix (wHTH) protein/tetratricopeptide (TPR) repeat protein